MAFTESERGIFFYEYEGKRRVADPLPVMRKLRANPTIDLETDVKRIDSQIVSEVDGESQERLAAATIEAFGLEPLRIDDTGEVRGITESEAIRLMTDLFLFLEDIAKKNSRNATLPPSTEPEQSEPSTTKPS